MTLQTQLNHQVAAMMLSRLDYCNSVLTGLDLVLPSLTIAAVQRAQNAAARLVLRQESRDQISPAFTELRNTNALQVSFMPRLLVA